MDERFAINTAENIILTANVVLSCMVHRDEILSKYILSKLIKHMKSSRQTDLTALVKEM